MQAHPEPWITAAFAGGLDAGGNGGPALDGGAQQHPAIHDRGGGHLQHFIPAFRYDGKPGLGFGEDEVVRQRSGRERLEVQLQRGRSGGRILGGGQDGQAGQQERNDDGVIHDGGNR